MAWNFAQYISSAVDTFLDIKKQQRQENEFNQKMAFETNQQNLLNSYRNKIYELQKQELENVKQERLNSAYTDVNIPEGHNLSTLFGSGIKRLPNSVATKVVEALNKERKIRYDVNDKGYPVGIYEDTGETAWTGTTRVKNPKEGGAEPPVREVQDAEGNTKFVNPYTGMEYSSFKNKAAGNEEMAKAVAAYDLTKNIEKLYSSAKDDNARNALNVKMAENWATIKGATDLAADKKGLKTEINVIWQLLNKGDSVEGAIKKMNNARVQQGAEPLNTKDKSFIQQYFDIRRNK